MDVCCGTTLSVLVTYGLEMPRRVLIRPSSAWTSGVVLHEEYPLTAGAANFTPSRDPPKEVVTEELAGTVMNPTSSLILGKSFC